MQGPWTTNSPVMAESTSNSGFRAPRQWNLKDKETISSFESWKSNTLFHLSLCNEFAPFLAAEWSKASLANHGFADDGDEVTDQAKPKTAVQKGIALDRMLGLVAQYSPSLLRNDILKHSTSLSWIWKRLRRYFGFSQSEVNFLRLSTIKREIDERYETFYQRIVAHIEDNLLTVDSGLQHDGATPTSNEDLSPTTERLAVYLWITAIDPRLPAYISRVYAHDLQSKRLKDLQT